MQTLIKPNLKLKITSFDNSYYQVKENSNNLKFDLDFIVKEIPFKIDLINFSKNENETANIKICLLYTYQSPRD